MGKKDRDEYQVYEEEVPVMFSVLSMYGRNLVGIAIQNRSCGCKHIMGINKNGDVCTPGIVWDISGLKDGNLFLKDYSLSVCGEVTSVGVIWDPEFLSESNEERMKAIRHKVWGSDTGNKRTLIKSLKKETSNEQPK